MSNNTSIEWYNACGKIILFGEHAVVYGVSAIAAGIPNAMKARVLFDEVIQSELEIERPATPQLVIRDWDLAAEYLVEVNEQAPLLTRTFSLIVENLVGTEDLARTGAFVVEVKPKIPAASGLGASAALAVCVIRALSAAFGKGYDDEQVNELAYRCEQLAHGKPSGLDNTLATYGGLLEYQRDVDTGEARFQAIQIHEALKFVVSHSGKKGFTAETVARIRRERNANPARIDTIFRDIENTTQDGKRALTSSSIPELAECMNRNHESLSDLGVSCDEIEHVRSSAHRLGASGSKLTGSGDGGAVIILTMNDPEALCLSLNSEGIVSFIAAVGA